MGFAMLSCVSATAQKTLTQTQEKAQRSFYFYLDKMKFKPEVDMSDNSVCFRQNDVLYWVTFSDTNPMLYTLHRKGYKVGEGKDLYKKEPAIIAANEINKLYPGIKVTVNDDKVSLELQTYAASTQDYNNVFTHCLGTFKTVDTDFKKLYKKALDEKIETDAENMRQINEMISPSTLRGQIKSVSFRLLDGNNKPVSDYNEPLRAYLARYIQPCVEFNQWNGETRNVKLFVRIITPDGDIICLPGKKYTAVMNVTLEKNKKDTIYEEDVVGSEKEGFWKPGEYKFEILDGLDVIYDTRFNIL